MSGSTCGNIITSQDGFYLSVTWPRFEVHIGTRLNGHITDESLITQEEFEDILDRLRPDPAEEVDVETKYIGKGKIALYVSVDGKTIKTVSISEDTPVNEINELHQSLIEKFSGMPRLWPRCRGTISEYLNVEITKEFNIWFDDFAKKSQ